MCYKNLREPEECANFCATLFINILMFGLIGGVVLGVTWPSNYGWHDALCQVPSFYANAEKHQYWDDQTYKWNYTETFTGGWNVLYHTTELPRLQNTDTYPMPSDHDPTDTQAKLFEYLTKVAQNLCIF